MLTNTQTTPKQRKLVDVPTVEDRKAMERERIRKEREEVDFGDELDAGPPALAEQHAQALRASTAERQDQVEGIYKPASRMVEEEGAHLVSDVKGLGSAAGSHHHQQPTHHQHQYHHPHHPDSDGGGGGGMDLANPVLDAMDLNGDGVVDSNEVG